MRLGIELAAIPAPRLVTKSLPHIELIAEGAHLCMNRPRKRVYEKKARHMCPVYELLEQVYRLPCPLITPPA